MFKVTMNDPAYPKGTELEVVGLGLFTNGETREVDADEADAFEAKTGQKVNDALKGSASFKVETSKGGDK